MNVINVILIILLIALCVIVPILINAFRRNYIAHFFCLAQKLDHQQVLSKLLKPRFHPFLTPEEKQVLNELDPSTYRKFLKFTKIEFVSGLFVLVLLVILIYMLER